MVHPNIAYRVFFALMLSCIIPAAAASDNSSLSSFHQTTTIYRQYTFSRSLGVEPFVEIGVGILASVLLVISALAYYRDRRKRFLIVCLAFFTFTIKGLLGVLDLLVPRDASMLGTFSDLLDFVILFLLFIAVIKD